ncbi:unnamed protein product [Clonostachys solani]|uniref:Uncharacterized protein n=1 Tax=Clonostachys solani TaxID=160281 RepID=A0A9P0EI61_9HYPO|nr:unnamed protein product [Clonostachys solani]
MASSTPDSYLEEHKKRDRSGKPSPLRIVKRFSSEDSFYSPRSLSLRSNASMQECDGDDGCLTIMKRKRERHHGGFALEKNPHAVANPNKSDLLSGKYHWEDGMVCKGGMLGSQTLNVRKTRQPRPSIQSHLGLRMQCARVPSASSCSPELKFETLDAVQADDQSIESPTSACSQDIHQSSRLPSPTSVYPLDRLQNRSCTLCPHVVVTAEFNTLQDCQRTIWAAIEVSGRLSTLSSKVAACDRTGVVTGTFIEHELDRFFEFGCLYDLSVEVLPAAQTTVIQVLREQTFPTTIYAGSSILLLAEIRIDADQKCLQRPVQGHVRQKSEELIEDLEIQLGSSQFNYMHVKVSYAHSVFPESDGSETGISNMHSRLETVATASLKPGQEALGWQQSKRSNGENASYKVMPKKGRQIQFTLVLGKDHAFQSWLTLGLSEVTSGSSKASEPAKEMEL